jgi:geranylgeranyl pyrophosphate synthase
MPSSSGTARQPLVYNEQRVQDVPKLFRAQVATLVTTERLTADLADCVHLVTDAAASCPAPLVHALTRIVAGGKRLRPLLTLAAAHSAKRFGAAQRSRAVRAAAVVELLHQASLVHDDVFDDSPLRHGAVTLNAEFGLNQAVLAGDCLLARALQLGCEIGSAEGALAAKAFLQMCQGQAEEWAQLFDPGRREQDYFDVIAGKTGALFSAACRFGAMAGGLSNESTEVLATFGMRLGIAFQLLDDVLDFAASTEAVGKPVGHDVVEGVYTLPLIRTLREHPEAVGAISGTDRKAAARKAVEIVRGGDGMAATLGLASTYGSSAAAELAGLGDDVRPEAVAVFTGLASALTGSPSGVEVNT